MTSIPDVATGDTPPGEQGSPRATRSDREAVPQPDMNVWLVGQQVSPTQRRGRYDPKSFSHPAKMLPELARRIVATYSREGHLVVDLMSGIGTTGVEAQWLNRRYVGVEVESKFAVIQGENLELAAAHGAAGEGRIILGDAQADHGLRDVDLVTFSPPYEDAIHTQGDELARIQRKIANGTASEQLRRRFENWDDRTESAQAGTRSSGYSSNTSNVGHQKGFSYQQSMTQIYQRAFESLRPGGYLAVVTKDQRDRKTGELTNVYGDTVDMCKAVGFQLHQHVVALLCKIDENTGEITPRTSHWQRMAVKKSLGSDRVVLLGQFEDVAIFRKPL